VVSSTPRPHFTPGKDPVPIVQEARWAPGPVSTGGISRPHRNSIPDRSARSQSLYRLSYPAHNFGSTNNKQFHLLYRLINIENIVSCFLTYRNRATASFCCCALVREILYQCYLEDGGGIFLRIVGAHQTNSMTSLSARTES